MVMIYADGQSICVHEWIVYDFWFVIHAHRFVNDICTGSSARKTLMLHPLVDFLFSG